LQSVWLVWIEQGRVKKLSLQRGEQELVLRSRTLVAHAYNPCIWETDWKDLGLRLDRVNSLQDPHLQNNQSKMDWKCG
jgi:hypothetical protein